MPVILLPWTRQPQFLARPRKTGLGEGLQMLLLPHSGGLIDVVNPGQIWTPTANAAISATQHGQAASFDGVGDYYASTGYPQIVGATGTFFVWCPEIGTQDINGHVWWGTNTTATVYFMVSNAASNSVLSFAQFLTSANSGAIYSTKNTSLVFSAAGTAASKKVFFNGASIGTADGVAPTAFAAGSKSFRFGGWIGGVDWDVNGKAVIAGYTSKPWDTAQAKAFNDDPWQIFEPRRRQFYIGALGILFDAASNSGYQAASSSYSWSHTWSGINRCLSVNVGLLSVPGTTVTALTYGGAAMTLVGVQNSASGAMRTEQWRMTSSDAGAPAVGSNTIAVTLSAAIVSAGTAVSRTGVHQTLPTEGFNGAQFANSGVGNDASVSITSVADNCWINAAIVTSDGSVTANQTARNNVTGAAGSAADEDFGPKTPAGAVTMSFTGLGITDSGAIAGYAIRPTAASGLSGVLTTFNPPMRGNFGRRMSGGFQG